MASMIRETQSFLPPATMGPPTTATFQKRPLFVTSQGCNGEAVLGRCGRASMGAQDTMDLTRASQRTVLPDDVREPPVFFSREERIRRFKLDVGVESLHWHDW